MKTHLGLIFVLTVMTGCLPIKQAEQPDIAQLTPWHTATSNSIAATVAPALPFSTPTAALTPTPTIHVVALGETISSIALRYGLDMNTLLAANPDIDPYSLIVGDQVIIPIRNDQTQIEVLTEPLALEVSPPKCSRTSEGGLWCFGILSNPHDEAAANLAVTFSMTNASSEEIASQTVPAILNKLEPGDSIPAATYFAGPLPNTFEVAASLASAFPASQSGETFYAVDTGNPVVEISGRLAKVTGEAVTAADPGITVDVWVAALAYDVNGNLVGMRRAENPVTLEQGKGVNFNLHVYSTGSTIDTVVIKAEALLVNQ